LEPVVKTQIGAYEAKTKQPELLRAVKAGKRFTITNRGEAIADLVPSEETGRSDPRTAIEKFQTFMKTDPVKGRVRLRELIDEGRE
jgi:prevent-host-death family protein